MIKEMISKQGPSLLELFDIKDLAEHLKRHGYVIDKTGLNECYVRIADYIEEQLEPFPSAAKVDIIDEIKKYLELKEDMLARYY